MILRLGLGQRLRQPDRMRRARRGRLGQHGEFHRVLRDLRDARLGFVTVAVEDGEMVADILADNMRAVVRLLGVEHAFVEGGCVVAFHNKRQNQVSKLNQIDQIFQNREKKETQWDFR
jgi:hypothetical protein